MTTPTLAEIVAVIERWAPFEYTHGPDCLLARLQNADAELFDEEQLARVLFDQWAHGQIKFIRDATAEGVAAAIIRAAKEAP